MRETSSTGSDLARTYYDLSEVSWFIISEDQQIVRFSQLIVFIAEKSINVQLKATGKLSVVCFVLPKKKKHAMWMNNPAFKFYNLTNFDLFSVWDQNHGVPVIDCVVESAVRRGTTLPQVWKTDK